jgi:hypothetical protein
MGMEQRQDNILIVALRWGFRRQRTVDAGGFGQMVDEGCLDEVR